MMPTMAKVTDRALTTTLSVDHAEISAAIVEEMGEFIAMFDGDLRFVGANRNLCRALGREAEDLLGTPGLELIAPADRDRAGLILGIAQHQGAMAGMAPFDLLCADGAVLTIQVTGLDLLIGEDRVLVIVGRPAYETIAIGLVLDRLLANEELDRVLEPLLDLFAWRQAGSGVAITWTIDGSMGSVSTSLPEELTGMADLDVNSAWATSLALGEGVHGSVDDLLDTDGQELARDLGFGQIWVEPVTTTSAAPDAVITVLTAVGGYSPLVHRFGVDESKRYLSVVLRWHDGLRQLEDAARRDELTGLANRRAFFDVLTSTAAGGAILFADLDGFKAVNDRWGHPVGDAVLSEMGRRLVASVDAAVCVARVGGDEFAVILVEASADEAADTAERIRRACAEPIDVDGITISLGISVGVSHSATDLGDAALHAADRDQYADKRRRNRAR